ncbi:hypothetical protein B9Z55_021845 [Caenorhabditis nigoni]|uniref:3'-5' exonuclease domain-containing protein n=1 Tax=Caenorhabditis nigoni TaxID=1611254 RepID=A0A2G5TTQ9_9PELO|nr:hypothetical protein B9Z55_021845 [Caenorhabditis nigoni]
MYNAQRHQQKKEMKLAMERVREREEKKEEETRRAGRLEKLLVKITEKSPELAAVSTNDTARRVHMEFAGLLRSDRIKKKKMSFAAIAEKVLEGYRVGPYELRKGLDIAISIADRFDELIFVEREEEGGEEGYLMAALEPILLRGDQVRLEDVEELEMLRLNAIRKLEFPSFNPKNVDEYYDIVVLKGCDGFGYLRKFRTREGDDRRVNGRWNGGYKMNGDLFVDTESIMTPNKLALIAICCPKVKSVLLWRVHEMSPEGLTEVQRSIEDLALWRGGKLVVFGKENFFNERLTRNIQPNVHPMPALLDVAKNHRVILSKSETLSNWGVYTLREDQKEYAAMDALVLYAIDGGRILEQDEHPLRKFLLTFTH